MSGFLPVPKSSGFDDEEDVEDSSATIRQFMESIHIERVTGPHDLMCYKLNPETKLYRADTERLQNGVNHGIATDYLPNEGPVFLDLLKVLLTNMALLLNMKYYNQYIQLRWMIRIL
jgi:hypothetical protein